MMLRLPLHDHYAGAMSQNERELAADLAKRVAEDDAADVAEGDEALAHDGGGAVSDDDDPTYAEMWADSINQTYTDAYDAAVACIISDLDDDEDPNYAIRCALAKAAQCLRNGVPATFTAGELDAVRHLMPAHEVRQSGAVRWVRDNYGPA